MKIPVIDRQDHHCSVYEIVCADDRVVHMLEDVPASAQVAIIERFPLISQLRDAIRMALWYQDSYTVRDFCQVQFQVWERGVQEYKREQGV